MPPLSCERARCRAGAGGGALGLGAADIGIVMLVGPVVVALSGVPAGRMVDRVGAGRMTILGLIALAAGSVLLAMLPATLGVPGYILPIVVVTLGYAVFQTANNTAVMKDVRQDQRGVISGMLNLSRNLGLITGASVMGAVFALAAGTSDIAAARPEDVATGMRTTFAVATTLIGVALVFAVTSQTRAMRTVEVRRFGGHPDTEDDHPRKGVHDVEDASTLPAGGPGGPVRLSPPGR